MLITHIRHYPVSSTCEGVVVNTDQNGGILWTEYTGKQRQTPEEARHDAELLKRSIELTEEALAI